MIGNPNLVNAKIPQCVREVDLSSLLGAKLSDRILSKYEQLKSRAKDCNRVLAESMPLNDIINLKIDHYLDFRTFSESIPSLGQKRTDLCDSIVNNFINTSQDGVSWKEYSKESGIMFIKAPQDEIFLDYLIEKIEAIVRNCYGSDHLFILKCRLFKNLNCELSAEKVAQELGMSANSVRLKEKAIKREISNNLLYRKYEYPPKYIFDDNIQEHTMKAIRAFDQDTRISDNLFMVAICKNFKEYSDRVNEHIYLFSLIYDQYLRLPRSFTSKNPIY